MNIQLQEIKERLPITEVLADYVTLRKAGVNFKAVCPFHNEKTASLVVSPSKGIWHCFGCGLGGDIFEFVKQMENVEFAEALKILADRAGVELRKPTAAEVAHEQKKGDLYEINDEAAKYYQKVLWESSQAHEALAYLKKRGLTDATIRIWRLGWAPEDFHYLENFLSKKYQKADLVLSGLIIKNDDRNEWFDRFRGRIMFPIINIHGQVVGFTGRLLQEKEGVGKYINSPETPIYNKSREIYGLYQAKTAIRKTGRAILMEGNMDVISAHQAGSIAAVASSGTAFGLEQFAILKRFCENLVFAFDADAAGSAATRRALEIALSLSFNVKVVDLGGAKDPDELIRRGIGAWQKVVDGARGFVEFFFDKTFAEYDKNSVDGKREIAKNLAPLIYRIQEPVTQAHFVRKLAEALGVAERSIWDIIVRLEKPRQALIVPQTAHHKTRQDMLTDQVLGLSLLVKNEKYLSELGLNIPAEADKRELLMFAAETETAEQDLDPATELARTASELKRLILRQKMERVTSDLMAAEKNKDRNLTEKLSVEFAKLSQQMKGLN
ncbi:MAG TPA: DNA primase [Patescibacteria group bacterium]|nr:DNA primase [Patescibacteria group bacterium]